MKTTTHTSSSLKSIPANLGYAMPAEWAPHKATWLSWPHNEETWPGARLKKVEETYLQMLEALLPHEIVNLLVNDEKEEDYVCGLLRGRRIDAGNLHIHRVPTVDTWIRDYGPTFLKTVQGKKAWCKWIFNAWGGKYPSLAEDTRVFNEYKDLTGIPYFDAGFILEGGSIEVNGEGVCLTTEQCLMNANRNSHLSRRDLEERLRNYLGVNDVIWMHEGIVGDDTDGHIDDIVRFTDSKTIVAAFEDNSADANYPILKENWDRLKQVSKENGREWNLVKLPMPGKVMSEDRDRLPASYANFYIANETVLLPVYSRKNDEKAEKILREMFPNRSIVPIECTDLVYGLGSIHCVTQQEPA